MTVSGIDGPGAPRVRVLHLLPDLAIGGGQTIVLNHVRHADRSRYEVQVASLFPTNDLAPAFVEAGCPPVCLNHRVGNPLPTLVRLLRLLKKERIDILHVHSVPDRKIGQSAAVLAGVPVVGHLHALWVHLGVMLPDDPGPVRRLRGRLMGAGRDWVERRAVRQYVAESEAVEDRFGPLVTAPITVLQQTVAVDRIGTDEARAAGRALRRELGIGDEQLVVLNVSRLDEGKGHVNLVKAFAELAERWHDAVLVVAGEGPERGRVQAEIDAHDLSDRVHLLGSRLDIPAVLATGDLFAFMSEGEGFGLAVLEAMAASLPVVAYRLPPLEEFTIEGETAELVTLGDLDGFVKAADDLLGDPARRAAMGAAGRLHVEQRFPADGVARTFEQVYRAVTDGATVGSPALGTSPSGGDEDDDRPRYSAPRLDMVPFLPPTAASVLDVGCGAGGLGALLKRDGRRLYAVEPDEAAAAAAQRSGDYDLVVTGTFPEVEPELPGGLDAIYFNDVLEHMVTPEDALRAARRLLGPDGVVIASIPNVRNVGVVKPLILDGEWEYEDLGLLDRTHVRFFTRRSMVRLFEEHGFVVERIEGLHPRRGRALDLLATLSLGRLDDFLFEQYAVVARPRPSNGTSE